MLDELAREATEVERVAYLDGVLYASEGVKEIGVVTTLTIPDAYLSPGRFEVCAEAMSQAGKHLRADRLVRLVQVHTHPGEWVGHSRWDDAHAFSQLPGALSVVLPCHAHSRPGLEEAGVHLRTERGWLQLTEDEIDRYLRVIPAFRDFRSYELLDTAQGQMGIVPIQEDRDGEEEVERHGTDLKPARKRPWWAFITFWKRWPD